jgi:hypothetical protein
MSTIVIRETAQREREREITDDKWREELKVDSGAVSSLQRGGR